MYCTKCGKALPENSIFCPNCGSKIDSVQNRTVSDKDRPLIKNKEKIFTSEFGLSILLGVSVSELFFVIYYVLLKFHKDDVYPTRLYLKFLTYMTVAFAVSLKYAKPYILEGVNARHQLRQLRGVIGTSIGAIIINWSLLTSTGITYDMESTLNKLLGEAIFFIVITIVLLQQHRKKSAVQANMTSLFYLAYIYNWLFWLMVLISGVCDGKIPDSMISLFAMTILLLPLVVTIIAGISFIRHRNR